MRPRRTAKSAPGGSAAGSASANAPSRASTMPARASRKRSAALIAAVLRKGGAIFSSELPARMQRDDAAGEVAIGDALEPSRLQHRREARLVGKAADRFHQILI